MKLNDFFKDAPAITIDEITIDSRKKVVNGLFFCIEGIRSDGHLFVDEAIRNGAVAIVYNKEITFKEKAVFIKVNDTLKALGRISSIFYDNPSFNLDLIGIIGNSGKTIISNLLKQFLSYEINVGTIGSYGVDFLTNHFSLGNFITPNIIETNNYLKKMLNSSCKCCILEISNLGLKQKRVCGLDFDIICFSNFIQDSKNNENNCYGLINFVNELKSDLITVLNVDDPYSIEIVKNIKTQIVSYGIENEAYYMFSDIEFHKNGTILTFKAGDKKYRLSTNYIGLFNMYNLLAALSIYCATGNDMDKIIKKINNLDILEGRANMIDYGQSFNVIVDYAKNNKALVDIFELAKEITSKEKRIIVIFGDSGRKDKNKRKILGEIADKYCDLIILTEDNPLDESVIEICRDIEKGIEKTNHLIIESRQEAINIAISMLNKDDTLLILGKGNEKIMYREFGNEYYDGDYVIAKKAIIDSLKKEENYETSEIY